MQREKYTIQAIKLAKKLGGLRAANELGISKNTLYIWIRKAKEGYIATPKGDTSPEEALSLTGSHMD